MSSLKPSPFAPDQFLASSDIEDESPHSFIKKRPLEVTEDLVAGRFESVYQRRRSTHTASRGTSEPPQAFFPHITERVEPMTPPNPLQSPISLPPRDSSLSRGAERLRQSRRSPKTRRSLKIRRSCTGLSRTNNKSPTRDSSPALARSRSPLGRWTPPTVSTFQPFSADSPELPTTPPPRPVSTYPFRDHPSHVWNDRISWTIPSPSSSPYSSHSPLHHSEQQA